MAVKTLLTIQDYAAMEEPGGVRYELSGGELIVSPSSSYVHNRIRDKLNFRLQSFVEQHRLGIVTCETDLQLATDTVRRPDVAFIQAGRLQGVDLEQSPLPVAPDLAFEIVSKNDRADDLMVKVEQYLHAGAQAVWLLYPKIHLAHRYARGKLAPEVRDAAAGQNLEEPETLPGFSVPLSDIIG